MIKFIEWKFERIIIRLIDFLLFHEKQIILFSLGYHAHGRGIRLTSCYSNPLAHKYFLGGLLISKLKSRSGPLLVGLTLVVLSYSAMCFEDKNTNLVCATHNEISFDQ